MKFTFSIKLLALPVYDEPKEVETFTGKVEADNHDDAVTRACTLAWKRCRQLEQERGGMFGYDPNTVRVVCVKDEPAHDAFVGPMVYQQYALRTLAPSLTTNQRLGLCGLGLAGEVGEVADMLKSFLYHRNGKPLDRDKLKDELGDVLWYFAVLLDTLGLTFEDVMAANAAKMEKRHPNSFNPHYQSDSHASEE